MTEEWNLRCAATATYIVPLMFLVIAGILIGGHQRMHFSSHFTRARCSVLHKQERVFESEREDIGEEKST